MLIINFEKKKKKKKNLKFRKCRLFLFRGSGREKFWRRKWKKRKKKKIGKKNENFSFLAVSLSTGLQSQNFQQQTVLRLSPLVILVPAPPPETPPFAGKSRRKPPALTSNSGHLRPPSGASKVWIMFSSSCSSTLYN